MLLEQQIGGTKASSGSTGSFGFDSDDNSCSAAILLKKEKCKFVPLNVMRARVWGEVEVWLHSFLTSALDAGEG